MARHRRPGEQDLPEGTRLLGRYDIIDRIGSGGMATIYRATDERLDRVVCIKLLRTTLVEGSGSNNTSGRAVFKATYSHFLKEALALSKLQHPNTLRIFDFGYLDPTAPADGGAMPENGAPFHVSEYLDGGNLETHIRLRGALPAEEMLGILEGISGALAEAHEHDIIHRDIKPSNILFARVRGALVPKLADFGIAQSNLKQRDGAEESISTVALFSPRWAAPEQLCGSPEGPRTDVYALGLLVVFMLTGKVLFGDDDVRITFNDRVRSDQIVQHRLAQLAVGGDVGRVLTQSMIARPDDRIATAPELFEALRFALRGRPPLPPPQGPPPVVPVPQTYPPSSGQHVAPPASSQPRGQQQPSSGSYGVAIRAPGALSLEVEGSSGARAQAAPERIAMFGERRVRYVQVHERLDLSFLDAEGGQVRVRVTMLPGPVQKLNVKGLSCFVARPGLRPTPALTVTEDGVAEMMSAQRVALGELRWSFGEAGQGGRLFIVDGRQLLVPFSDGQQVIALMLNGGSDLVVMCRR